MKNWNVNTIIQTYEQKYEHYCSFQLLGSVLDCSDDSSLIPISAISNIALSNQVKNNNKKNVIVIWVQTADSPHRGL